LAKLAINGKKSRNFKYNEKQKYHSVAKALKSNIKIESRWKIDGNSKSTP